MKVLAANDLVKSSTPRVVSTQDLMERMPRVSPEAEADRLGLERKPKDELNKTDVANAVETINNAIEHVKRALRFSIHEETERIVVRVVDLATDEVIKEIPPEEVLDTVARIREMIGLLIDERA